MDLEDPAERLRRKWRIGRKNHTDLTKQLRAWPVAAFVAAVLLGASFSMATTYPYIADVLFVLGLIPLLVKFVTWEEAKDHSKFTIPLACVSGFTVCVIMIFGNHWLNHKPPFKPDVRPAPNDHVKEVDPSVPSTDQARLEIVNIVLDEESFRDSQNHKAGTPHLLSFNVFYDNFGRLPSLGLIYRVITLGHANELTADEIAALMKQAEDLDLRPLFKGPQSELYSGNSTVRHYFSAPDKLTQSTNLGSQYDDIVNGTERLYMFIVMAYRDRSMPPTVVGITEQCNWFRNDFDVRHNCGTTRYFLDKVSR